MNLEELAIIVDKAARNATPISQLTLENSFDVDQSYEIQKLSIDRRLAEGEKLVGLKMGFTSEAKMKQMGVHDMIWGRLTDSMLLQDGGALEMDKCIHPRAEPELCFLTKKELNREITLEEIPEFIESVSAGVEIIDSRYENFKFSLEDVIADNCSSCGFAVGAWHPIGSDLSNLSMEMKIDNEVVQSGSSAAILGDPLKSILAAARLAHQYGLIIPANSYILAGAATPAVFLKRGQSVVVDVESLGEVSFTIQ